MKILLVDDHTLIGKSLEISFKNYDSITDFSHLTNPSKLHEEITKYNPDIVLMDIHMGEYSGLDIASEILEKEEVRIVFLTGFQLPEYQKKAEEIGGFGFLDKTIDISELVNKLNSIYLNNEKYFPQRLKVPELTLTEKKVLLHIANGNTQVETADILRISERTVRNHITHINQKFQTQTTIASIIKAIELGIIDVNLQ